MSTPPAGWHPDPEDNQQLRYWDGQQWTSATQPMPAAQTPTLETPEQKKDRKRHLVAIGIIIAAVASIAIFKSIDFSKDDTETAAAETTTTQGNSHNHNSPNDNRWCCDDPANDIRSANFDHSACRCANLEAAASRMQDAGAVDN